MPAVIDTLRRSQEEPMMRLILETMAPFAEVGGVIAASQRRAERLWDTYHRPGSTYLVVADRESGRLIGGAGLGPLAGLPPSEGQGEIRELVIEESFRGQGIGRDLITTLLDRARDLGYERIYLETTPQMNSARRLFEGFNFRPVEEAKRSDKAQKAVPQMACYYLLENLKTVLDRGA